MNVIMNAWNPDDVLNGEDVLLNANDIYLLESYLISDGIYQSLIDWKIKADKCADYQKKLGVQMACLSTTKTYDQFTQAWFGTAMYNFDYFQTTDIQYSATTNNLTFTSNPSSTYGTTWTSDTISFNADKTNFSRPTESWTLSISGNGKTWGFGTFTKNG